MITRKLGAVLRGKATPFQLVAACVLGAMLGFAPGFGQAPALLVLLFAALLVVNANLGLALLVAGVAKLLSFAAAPVSFRIGEVLLDGPTQGVARVAVNAPVLAWCGLEYYAVAGGQLLGFVAGGLAGLFVARAVGTFRRRMIAARDNPSRIRELASKPAARLAIWLFLGGAGKRSWEEKLGKRVGNPVRVWGAAVLVLLLLGAYAAQSSLASPYARRALRSGLEHANGATVDLGSVELGLEQGRLAVAGLALADPNALERDLFRAAHLEADVDQADLARRRLHLARVVVRDAKTGALRQSPGEHVGPAPGEGLDEPSALPSDPSELSLEDVLTEYETWRERLAQARGWLDVLAGDPADQVDAPGDETLGERLEREAREGGWLAVRADGLMDEAPAFRLSELVVDGLSADFLPGRVFDLRATELSSQPALLDVPPRVELVSRDGEVRLEVDLAPVSRGGGGGALRFTWKGLSVDDALALLRLPGPPPLRGGTLDLELDGAWDGGRIGWVDLPLRVTLRDTTVAVQGIEPTALDELVLPIGLRGPIDAPRIRFEHSAFLDALAEAGKQELANRLRARAGEELDSLVQRTGIELPGSLPEGLPTDLTEDVGAKLRDGTKNVLSGLLGGKP